MLNSICGPLYNNADITDAPKVDNITTVVVASGTAAGDCTPNKPLVDQSKAIPDTPTDKNPGTRAGVKINDIKTRNQKDIWDEYLLELEKIPGLTKGLKVLITSQAIHEGYYGTTRARRYHNPGNIGNTDDGSNKDWGTLAAGIQAQVDYVKSVANGTKFKFGKIKRSNKYSPELKE